MTASDIQASSGKVTSQFARMDPATAEVANISDTRTAMEAPPQDARAAATRVPLAGEDFVRGRIFHLSDLGSPADAWARSLGRNQSIAGSAFHAF